MGRGRLTDEVKKISKDMLGYEISQRELRLLPYLMSVTLDNFPMDRKRINRDENRILNKWEEKGFVSIESADNGRMLFLTERFYKAVSAILMVGYCSDMIQKEIRLEVVHDKEN